MFNPVAGFEEPMAEYFVPQKSGEYVLWLFLAGARLIE